MIFKAKISHIFCIFGILVAATHQTPIAPNVQHLIKGIENFGTSLYSKLAENNEYSQNSVVFSPFSVHTCLAMTRLGAEGETASQIDQVAFGLPSQKNKDLAENYHTVLAKYENSAVLKVANKIYAKKGLNVQNEFKEHVTKQFYSSVGFVNFENSEPAAKEINSWVEANTNNLIKDLVKPSSLDGDTRLVLVNAIYFKGQWVHQFPLADTHEMDFHLDDGKTTKVQMMSIEKKVKFAYLSDLAATAVELPYEGGDLSMLVILPNPRTGLVGLENKLKRTSLDAITQQLSETTVTVKLPRFKAEFKAKLKAPLTEMGMQRMFGENAEFGKMLTPIENLQVSAIVHKAYIEVNEVGTEAAAASDSELSNRFGDDSEFFLADHPFHYIIKNADNLVLFKGNFKGNINN